MNQTILLNNRPVGRPQLTDFKFVSGEKPQIGTNELLLKTTYVSVDPYLRGRMNDVKSYIAPFQLQKPITSAIVAEVIESNHRGFSAGDFVSEAADGIEAELVRDEQNEVGSRHEKLARVMNWSSSV